MNPFPTADAVPVVTTIIPTRNRPQDFDRALASVQAQRGVPFEVVVVDDGSSDAHRAGYAEIRARTSGNVRFVELMQREPGHGHCFARNEALRYARGEYISFLDDDDWWTDPDFLARGVKALQRHGADFLMANQAARTHDGLPVPGLWLAGLGAKVPAAAKDGQRIYPVSVPQLLTVNGFGHMNAWVLRRSLFVEAGRMDETLRYEPDYDVYMRLLDKAGKVLHDEAEVALHNVPDPNRQVNASTANSRVRKLLFQLQTADKHLCTLVRPEILAHTRSRKRHLLQHLAEALAKEGRSREALVYAREALALLPSPRWALRTASLALRART